MVKSTPSKKVDGKMDKVERLDPAARGNSKSDMPENKGLLGFFRSTREELEKVVWPTRQQWVGESIAVLLIVIVFAAFVFLLDEAFGWVAQQVFK